MSTIWCGRRVFRLKFVEIVGHKQKSFGGRAIGTPLGEQVVMRSGPSASTLPRISRPVLSALSLRVGLRGRFRERGRVPIHGEMEVQTQSPNQLVDITDEVQRRVATWDVDVVGGICFVYCSHTTAGLTINENADPDVGTDLLYALDRLVPFRDPAYRHGEGNSAAHLKASLMGSSVAVPIVDGRLALGTWQGIFLCEFDGPRSRRVTVVIQPSDS